MSKKTLTQKERVAQRLIEISINVTAKDRADYMKKEDTSITKQTLSRYLNGDVADTDRALKMLLFFRVQIQNRERAIV